jgi:sorbitol/mannitol transport system substrate-binding protein
VKTDSSGWLYTWAFGIQKASKKQEAAWKFISWASGKGYEELVGKNLGWAKVPDGKRSSTYQRGEYKQSSGSFSAQAEASIKGAKPLDPGLQPRPAPGIQFVGIPEFTDLGTQVSQQISSAIAGSITVDEALNSSQTMAEKVAAKYRGQ